MIHKNDKCDDEENKKLWKNVIIRLIRQQFLRNKNILLSFDRLRNKMPTSIVIANDQGAIF